MTISDVLFISLIWQETNSYEMSDVSSSHDVRELWHATKTPPYPSARS